MPTPTIWCKVLHQLRRGVSAVQEQAVELVTLLTEQGFPIGTAIGTMLEGWALTERGLTKEGIEQMLAGIAALRATGTGVVLPHLLGLLARAYGNARQTEEALSVIDEALTALHSGEQGMWEAEVYQLKGVLSLQAGIQVGTTPNFFTYPATVLTCFYIVEAKWRGSTYVTGTRLVSDS